MDRFRAIETFARVVESGSFARAAERLDLSTSAVSRQVSDLEAHAERECLSYTLVPVPNEWRFENSSGERYSLSVSPRHRANSGRMLSALAAADLGGDYRARFQRFAGGEVRRTRTETSVDVLGSPRPAAAHFGTQPAENVRTVGTMPAGNR